MDLATVTAIRGELETELAGRRFGKIIPLSKTDLAIDFRLPDSRYLFLSIAPGNPRAYLIRRKLREIEKTASSPTPFMLGLRKKLSGAELTSVTQVPHERILFFNFDAVDEVDGNVSLMLAAQLTGNSANLLLLDSEKAIIDRARDTKGQAVGESYEPPGARRSEVAEDEADSVSPGKYTLSERLDAVDAERWKDIEFSALIRSPRNKMK